MSLYPLTLRFPVLGGAEISVEIRPDGFTVNDRPMWARLPASERLRLRSEFEAQVALAKATPTKGDQ